MSRPPIGAHSRRYRRSSEPIEEQAFVQSHLLYLNLLAQADQIALLEDIQTRLADNQAAQEELVDVLLSARAAVDDDELEPDDGFYEDDTLEDGHSDEEDGGFYPEGSFEEDEGDQDFEDRNLDLPPVTPDPIRPAETHDAPVVIDVPSETTEVRAEGG